MSNYGGQYEQKPNQQYGAAPGQYYQPTADDKTWAMLAHISPIVGLGFIGPLIVWLIYKDKSPFVADQAKEALNFSLAVLIAVLVLCATCIGIIVAPVVSIGALVYGIIAAMEANKGVWYRYPYTFRMIN
jgi:uncharacterized Tic20 family protein